MSTYLSIDEPPALPEETPAPEAAPALPPLRLPALPATLREVSPAAVQRAIVMAGYHASWIRNDASTREAYAAMGLHFPRAGEGFVVHEDNFPTNDRGEFVRGDAVLAVCTDEAYREFLHRLHEKTARDLQGGGKHEQLVVSEERG